MARLEDLPEPTRSHLAKLACPSFESTPWVPGTGLSGQRVAIVSTAGLHRREDRPFTFDAGDHYRLIPYPLNGEDLVMSHVSANFDRSGFQQDLNVVFPIDRLRELAAEGMIDSVASIHYSFMGAIEPTELEAAAREAARVLKQDGVNAALLVPV